ncbi:VWA domain-containing protein [Streptomyces sp. MST-110588]|uniref:VWA domain-containing protein n=1 Tax=Streptomyces sp. MST-110588 TaxID=2833628 RepID=UPI001F5D47B5|nr:VWA domain-containing protein [Streptomyces sp. MST-110588]UNO41081.1 VWA domain-containing protein [Streptomyces sp. MST-110588]
MGIRSLLRNAFGRSKETREEPDAAPDGVKAPGSAAIPEAREEAGAKTKDRESGLPAARSAPADPPAPTLPSQSTPPHHSTASQPEEPATSPASDLVTQAFDTPTPDSKPETEPEAALEPKAQPEPQVVPEPKVQPEPKAEPELRAEAEPQAEADPEPQPTSLSPLSPVSLTKAEKVEKQAPGLVSLYKAAAVTLEKRGLATQRAAVYLVLDRSGSMRNYYKDGTVQHLAEQALGLSANLDDDGTVPVIFFSTDVDGTADLDLTNYEGRIEELHAGLGHMGRTNYHWAINAVVEHYEKSGATDPAFVIFQTDGAPTSRPAAEKALCEAAKLPIFWQFVGFGDPDAKGFDFLRKLDDLAVPEKRVVDNAGFFHAGRDPRALADSELYQQLMIEFPEWLTEARTAGILNN